MKILKGLSLFSTLCRKRKIGLCGAYFLFWFYGLFCGKNERNGCIIPDPELASVEQSQEK